MQGNINAGGRGRQTLSNVDFYRRVPKDLTEATTLGALMSIVAMGVMSVLFFSETLAFARTSLETAISMDDNEAPQIRLNFNVTLMDLNCDYVSVDVWDSLGTNRQNVTKNVEKWQLDAEGKRRIFSGRNREAREVRHEEHEESLEDMHADGVHAKPLTKETFETFLKENEVAFVDLYAPWCIWCQRLLPTWEKFAEEVESKNMPVGVGSVDCVTEAELCRTERVMAFPTLRWYQEGKAVSPDYKMDRTVVALTSFAKRKLETVEKFKDWDKREQDPEKRKRYKEMNFYNRAEHPGCQISGHLMVNRVPGNFHVEAKSVNHNLNAAMTNLTHRVNHLSFGEPGFAESRKMKRILKQLPEAHQQFNPMDDTIYPTSEYHQAYHHYIKVVSTHLDMSGGWGKLTSYQFLEQSQIVYYDDVNVPEARFSYDLSPMSVTVSKEGRKWYDYLTSLCAIIGGTFTTLGLIDAVLYKFFKAKKI
mmetsp:Transcript_42301/g.128322  ORF Transcript_42301/g.128322 Transcript_42301/m.128322 type:complete len:477 (-) Transcript_42301:424-1854(-)